MRIRLRPEIIARLPPAQQREALELLRRYEESARRNPLQLYRPNGPKYAATHEAQHTARTRALFGGNRSGKTTLGIIDDIIQATPLELLPRHLHRFKKWGLNGEPFYCRIMTPDMERTMKPVIHLKLREWLPKDLLKDGSWDKSYDKGANCLRLEGGSRFDFLSYEMALDKFGGAALHRNHYDEEPPEDIRNECLMRLVDYGGDELFTMTPLSGLTWTYRKLWRNRGTRPSLYVERVTIYDNPTLSPEGIRAIEEELRAEGGEDGAPLEDEEVRRRLRGEFVHMGGVVYPDGFNQVLVDEPSGEHVRQLETVVGIDPGVRVAAMTWVGFDNDNHGLVYDQVYVRNGTTDDYAKKIREINEKWGLRVEPTYVIDPSARNRALTNAESVEAELQRVGIFTVHGQNQVEAGVQHIRRRLRLEYISVSRALRGLIGEAEEYRIQERDDGVFQVVKENDHALDATRYAFMHRPWMPDPDPVEEPLYPADVAFGPAQTRAPALASVAGALA